MRELTDILPILHAGIEQLSLAECPESLAESLADYLLLLNKWNQAYNLTAVRDIKDMAGRHILDSLAIRPWVNGSHILDVGTGAGLPGIPLAMACPDKQFVLLDSNGKKTRFLHEVKRVLGLKNVDIVQARVQDYVPLLSFDTVLSRAFAEVQKMLDATQHLLAPDGVWVAMKGPNVTFELSHIPYLYQMVSYAVLGVPGERYCVVIERHSDK